MSKNEPAPTRLKNMRKRAGLSMDKLAKACGYKTSSGISRYENAEEYREEYLPLHFVRQLLDVLPGMGTPPITREEVMLLAGLSEEVTDAAAATKTIDKLRTAYIVGTVETDKWQTKFKQPSPWEFTWDVSGDTSSFPKWAARAGDNSFEAFHLTQGGYALFFELKDVGGMHALRDGSLVIVLRRRNELVEATVMQYCRLDSQQGALLYADKKKDPVLSSAGGVFPSEFEIVGLVFHCLSPTLQLKPLYRPALAALVYCPALAIAFDALLQIC